MDPSDFGAGEWTRTIDLLITNQLLYQLSYAGAEGRTSKSSMTEARSLAPSPEARAPNPEPRI